MDNHYIEHRATREYLYPDSRRSLALRVFTSPEITAVSVVYFKRNTSETKKQKMQFTYQNRDKKLWTIHLQCNETVHYIKYFFELTDGQGNSFFSNELGQSEKEPQTGYFEFLSVGTTDSIHCPDWAKGIVFYQIFPDSFASFQPSRKHNHKSWNSLPDQNYYGGTLQGIFKKIPYLKDLGVECIYLNPIFNAEFNHKYATIDYFNIDPDFGTNQDLIELVKGLHENGIRIILDGVFNHTSTHFFAFEDIILHERSSRYVDWYYIESYPVNQEPLTYECVGDYCHMPKLNTGNPRVQEYILSVMEYWIQVARIDGWRLDVADEVEPSCWHYIRRQLKGKYPDCLLIGECWSDAYRIVGDGSSLDTTMNYLFRNALIHFFADDGKPSEFSHEISSMLMRYSDEVNSANYNLLGSHDTERFLTLCRGDKRKLKLATAFQMTFLGSPAIYYGDELGMEGGNDPGCRASMVWDAMDTDLHTYYKELIQFRQNTDILKTGSYMEVSFSDKDSTYIFMRSNANGCILVAFNNGYERKTVKNDLIEDYFGISSLEIEGKSFKIFSKEERK
jgi:glycosidase